GEDDRDAPDAGKSRPDPEDRSAAELKREADAVLEESGAVVRDSMRIRRRSQRIRDALQIGGSRATASASDHNLSRREKQVLTPIGAGKSSKEMAAALGIWFKTAVTHRASIMSKLDVHEIASVVREAIRRGLV